MSEKEKRDLGEWYDANFDEELLEERVAAIDLCFDLNQTRQSEREKRQQIRPILFRSDPETICGRYRSIRTDCAQKYPFYFIR